MLFGNTTSFAIECSLESYRDGFILGHFRMWAAHLPIGDFTDTVAVQACVNWLCDVLQYAGQRTMPAFDPLESAEVLQTITDTVDRWDMASDWRQRFLLNDVGMSAFDGLDIVLVERADHQQRVIWRERQTAKVHEALLAPGQFEQVSHAFLHWITQTPEWQQYQQWRQQYATRQ